MTSQQATSPAEEQAHWADGRVFLVSHGKSGSLGCFVVDVALDMERGTAVVIESVRGLEAGSVVGPATRLQARLLGPALAGRLLRPFTDADAERWHHQQLAAQALFDQARSLAAELSVPLEILDVDVFFDGSQVILQYVGHEDDAALTPLAESLQKLCTADIRFEKLNQTAAAPAEDHDHGGCGKPDCGKTSGAGGSCSTCGSGGGCSSCAKGSAPDLKDYFAHLRGKMDAHHDRVPLL